MKKIVTPPIFFLVLLISASVFGQAPVTQNSVKLFFEKVFVHTDRAVYAPGEDIWYKAYITNGQDNHLMGASKNLYIELIAPNNSIVSKQIITNNKGTGKGDFALTDNLAAGNYRLRAYTNWQRNFGDNFIFEKAITIVPGAASGKSMAKASAGKPVMPGTPQVPGGAPVIRFFPEGGSLVTDVTSIVAVKAEDAGGKGISVSGPILSAAGDTVARYTCDSLGMGLFAMLPQAGQAYHTTVKYMGQSVTANLPVALSSGLCLKAQKRDTLIYITISTNAAGAAAYTGKTFTLSIKHAGTAYVTKQIQLTDNVALIKLPESIMPEGIAAITLYDDQHKPNAERLVYVTHGANKGKLSVSVQKPVYKPREQVTVNIKASNGNKPLTGNFSMAAVDAGVNAPEGNNILAYMMLQSDIRGRIENPARYFDTTNVNRAKQLDILMLTQGWRDFVWRRLADTAIAISYLPEQGFTVSGTVKNETGNTPIANANITLSVPGAAGQKLFIAKADVNGVYYFDNLQLSGQQPIALTTRDAKGNPNGTIQVDSLSKNGLPVSTRNTGNYTVSPELAADMNRRIPSVKSLDSIMNLKEVKIKASNTVMFRDQAAVTSGYADEVLTVTPEDLSFDRLKDYIMYKSHTAKPDPNNPDQLVFFADGKTYHPRIVVDNKELVFSEDDDDQTLADYYTTYYNLPMTQVEKVVVKRLTAGMKPPSISRNKVANVLGNSMGGPPPITIENLFVIYLTLKPGAFFKNGRGITSATINGYYEARNFYKPIHGGGGYDSAKPDLRNTIHWEPEIKTDANGQATISFYNADPKSDIRIIVQGVTDNGDPLSGVRMYTVK